MLIEAIRRRGSMFGGRDRPAEGRARGGRRGKDALSDGWQMVNWLRSDHRGRRLVGTSHCLRGTPQSQDTLTNRKLLQMSAYNKGQGQGFCFSSPCSTLHESFTLVEMCANESKLIQLFTLQLRGKAEHTWTRLLNYVMKCWTAGEHITILTT